MAALIIRMYPQCFIFSVPFEAILGPNFRFIPKGRTLPFSQLAQRNSQSEVKEKLREKSVFIATKTNGIAIFSYKYKEADVVNKTGLIV